VPPNPTYAPCCTLEQIAQYGGSSHAYFADTPQDLQSALGSILASIGINATARTVPTFSPALTAGNAQMYNAWLYPNPGAPWAGDIKRSSYACTAGPGQPAVFVPTTVADGDDFASNLDMSASVSARTFYAMEPKNAANTVHDATASIRPFAPTTASPYDGNLFETSTAFTGTGVSAVGSIATGLTDDALAITPGTSSYQYTPLSGVGTEFLTDAVTEKMILSFTFGQAKPGTLPTDFGWESRCPSCNDGNTAALEKPSSFGDIYHATPTVVAAPGALLDDITYSGFRTNITATTGGDAGATTPRRPVVYAATNDGLLHAFYADQTLPPQAPNEAWSMLMPAAMPQLLSSYPATDKMLLDGSPIVKDVVWDRTTINSLLCASGSMTCPWHTSLVAGYGPTQQGYYSVDVTSPTSPVFRWQLTKMPTGNYQIFGKHSATPAIATINYKDPTSMSGTVHEVGVAILPGGSDGLPTGGACERIHNQSGTGTDSEPAGYQARSYVNCWGTPATYASPVEGRSLSIVRLDTGEILRVFARKADFNSTDLLLNAGPSGSPGVVTDTQLDSPMTGTPVVYPADVGAVATKIFVGDADGTVWRFDVSNPDSTKWFGDTFLDLYNPTVDPPHAPTSANPPGNYPDGQPFDVPIVTSLDTTGSLVLNIASGTTQTFDTNGIEYLYSVSEKAGGSPFKLRASVNWYWVPKTPSQTTTPSFLQQGERISGPMAVFNSTLFFATYWAGSAATGCNPGQAKLWGFDYVTPFDTTDLSKGGLRSPTMTCSPTQDWTTPNTTSCGVVESAVVPGVAILATPACSTTSTTSFAGGGSHTALSNIAQGSFSLVANVAAQGSTPGSQTQKALPTPVSPTRIDAWAAVVE
jgi:type IV pilus assembly protein PilY1